MSQRVLDTANVLEQRFTGNADKTGAVQNKRGPKIGGDLYDLDEISREDSLTPIEVSSPPIAMNCVRIFNIG